MVGDLDGDGYPEIVFGSDDDHVYAVDNRGSLLWRYETGGNVRATPTIADVDGDGSLDVAVGSDDRSLYVLDGKGNLK